ncbi:hypothetical protein, partial [Escherichia coli]|uniref:hypothetical protein n=1 Tax=Escherichia coli TaxID=562 RepID=UPI00201AB8EE
ADRNRSHWSTSKTPSYTKSVSWQHHRPRVAINYTLSGETGQKPKKTMLLNELETVQEEAKEAVNKKAKERAQVFFIGEQSTENPEIFYVSDYRLICAIMGYIIYP